MTTSSVSNASLENIRETIGTAIWVNLSMVTIEESEVNKSWPPGPASSPWPPHFAGVWE